MVYGFYVYSNGASFLKPKEGGHSLHHHTPAKVVILLSLSPTFTNFDIPQQITILLDSLGCTLSLTKSLYNQICCLFSIFSSFTPDFSSIL